MKKRIAVVEDNENNQLLIEDIFRKHRDQYTLSFFNSGAEFFVSLPEQLPDLILLDMRLPELSGWEIASRLKADESTQRLPIIAVTAHAMKGDRERALEAGCDDFITKPVERDTILEKVQFWLN